MHIPDGFLSTPVWLSLDLLSVPALGLIGRRAQRENDESKAPLLGVMGAFVFAAQMINFPVAIGTSGHLVGSALLVCTLGPASAAVVMTAILALQALVFQDGGLLALGANVFNMAFVGAGGAWLVYRALGSGRWRRVGIFAAGLVSVFAAACLAMAELLLSGIRMPGAVLWVSLGVFLVTATLEGAITLGVMEALSRINPNWIREPHSSGRPALGLLLVAALVLVSVGVLFASADPDGLEKLAEEIGIAEQAQALFQAPLADYEVPSLDSDWGRQAVAGLAGLILTAAACVLLARLFRRREER